jgi:hypothetical protein
VTDSLIGPVCNKHCPAPGRLDGLTAAWPFTGARYGLEPQRPHNLRGEDEDGDRHQYHDQTDRPIAGHNQRQAAEHDDAEQCQPDHRGAQSATRASTETTMASATTTATAVAAVLRRLMTRPPYGWANAS